MPGRMQVCLTAALLLCCLAVAGQTEENKNSNYHITNYTSDNGLPQNSVKSIVADSAGYIWMATESGVVRFDGIHFKTFDKTVLNIGSNRFSSIQLLYENGRRKLYALNELDESVQISGGTTSLAHTQWTQRVQKAAKRNFQKSNFRSGNANVTELTDNADFYILSSTGEGDFYRLENTKISSFSKWKKNGQASISHTEAWQAFRLGKYVLIPYSSTSFVDPFDRSSLFKFVGAISNHRNFGKEKAKIFWNNAANQVFASLSNDIYRCELASNGNVHTTLLARNIDLETMKTKSVFYDYKTNVLFLGSLTKGLFVVKIKNFTALLPPKGNNPAYYAQTIFDSNSVLTASGMLFDVVTRTQRPVDLKDADHAGGYSIARDPAGCIWYARDGNLYRFDPKINKASLVFQMDALIHYVYYDNQKILWVVCGTKLCTIDPLAFQQGYQVVLDSKSLIGISYLDHQPARPLLLGTKHGLYSLTNDQKKLERVAGTEKLSVRNLYSGKDGEIWITTNEDGLWLLKNDKLTKLPLDRGQRLLSAHYVFEDKNSFFWIPTNRGLLITKRQDLLDYAENPDNEIYYYYFDKDDGFETNEFNGACLPCAVRLPNNYISLPSLNGIVTFVPEHIVPVLPKNPIMIDKIEMGGKLHHFQHDKIDFGPGPEHIKVMLSSPFQGNLQNLQWSYALTEDGETPKASSWISIPAEQPVIDIGYLSGGNYKLWIRKAKGFGKDRFDYKTVSIDVEPYFYQTAWFIMLVAALLQIALNIWVRFKVKKVNRQNKLLEKGIAERTAHLNQTLLALQDSEKKLERQIYIQSRLVASISHDIRTPLKFIASTARKFSDQIKISKYELVKESADSLYQTANDMYFLLENLIGYSKTQVKGNQTVFVSVSLQELVEEKFNLFKGVFAEPASIYVNQVSSDIIILTDPYLLSMILHNLIDNASKYASKGEITIHTQYINNHLHLIVSDQGAGLNNAYADWLMQPPTEDERALIAHHGLGLLIVKEFSALLNISIVVENQKGTRIHLIFDPDVVQDAG